MNTRSLSDAFANQEARSSCFPFAVLSLLLVSNVHAQAGAEERCFVIVAISIGEPTADAATEAAEDAYDAVLNAVTPSNSTISSETGPFTTVFPNDDGTFDGVTIGEVCFWVWSDWFKYFTDSGR